MKLINFTTLFIYCWTDNSYMPGLAVYLTGLARLLTSIKEIINLNKSPTGLTKLEYPEAVIIGQKPYQFDLQTFCLFMAR